MKARRDIMSLKYTYSEPSRITSSLNIFVFILFIPLICLVGNWTTPTISSPTFIKELTAQVYLGSLITVWFWLQRNTKNTALNFSPMTLLLSGMFFLGTLSIFWSVNPDFYLTKWLKWYCAAIVFFFGLKIEQNEKNLSIIFNCFVATGTAVSLIGMAQFLFSFSWLPLQLNQPSSTFGNQNVSGQVIVLLAPFALFFLFSNKTSKSGVWAYSVCIAIMLTYAFVIRSVAVWLCCFLEALVITTMLIFDGSKRKEWFFWNRQKTLAALFSVLLFLVATNTLSIDVELFSDGQRKSGVQMGSENQISPLATAYSEILSSVRSTGGLGMAPRYMNIADAIKMIKENPVIGSGLGSFFEKMNNGGANHILMIGSQQVHNDTLELGVELGLVGLCLLMAIALTLCSCLLVILKCSEGPNRLGTLLLASALAGSLLNAQLSFPFQLVVPLVVVALLVAMLTRSAQEYSPRQIIKKVQVGNRFQKYSFVLSAFILTGIIFLNSQWMKDYNDIVDSVDNQSQLTPYIVESMVMNPELIALLRQASITAYESGRDQEGLNFLSPLIDFWPTAPVHAIQAGRHYQNLQNIGEAEKWAHVMINSQPKDSFLGELILLEVYKAKRNIGGIREIYNKLSRWPNEFLLGNSVYLETLITLSAILRDEGRPPLYYQQYIDSFRTTLKIETNMAVYYLNMEQYGLALPHMRKALGMDPSIGNAVAFKKILDKYTDSSIDVDQSDL